jgi:hypothetical protein
MLIFGLLCVLLGFSLGPVVEYFFMQRLKNKEIKKELLIRLDSIKR